jgi:hypothetical protein
MMLDEKRLSAIEARAALAIAKNGTLDEGDWDIDITDVPDLCAALRDAWAERDRYRDETRCSPGLHAQVVELRAEIARMRDEVATLQDARSINHIPGLVNQITALKAQLARAVELLSACVTDGTDCGHGNFARVNAFLATLGSGE